MPGMQDVATYKFCPQCGGRLEKRLIKPMEPRRLVCTVCGFIFYLDPKLSVIAVIPMNEGVVMVRRAINPGYGLWVVPGGFVDLGEVLEDALVRETQEETLLTVRPIRLLNIYSYPDHRTVIAAYVTEYVSGELAAGDETLEARVFGLKEIPWPQIAFSSTQEALREYISRYGQ
jgi:ADP-ribose pyrophosphatase YjhB (NUDIX family)